MARKKDSDGGVNLFPFLSILVSIIGCLTLIIVVVTLISMNKAEGKTEEEVTRSQHFQQLKKELEETDKELDKLRQLIETFIQQNQDQLAAAEELKKLKEALEKQEELEASRLELITKLNILIQTNQKLNADHMALMEAIKKKEEEIARRKLPPEPAALRVTGVGSSTTSKPYFVEVGNKSLYIHRSLSEEPVAIPLASLNQSEDFVNLLKEISSSPTHKLNFLIRGDAEAAKGYSTAVGLISAYNQANGTKILPGKLPLPNEGKVDLSTFARFLKP